MLLVSRVRAVHLHVQSTRVSHVEGKELALWKMALLSASASRASWVRSVRLSVQDVPSPLCVVGRANVSRVKTERPLASVRLALAVDHASSHAQ